MSNNAMSNETDLDWLARNVHAWPESTPHIIPAGDCVFEFGAAFWENHVCLYHREFADSKVIHKHQWLARRAELQNKPSWEGAPEWAELLAQDDSGEWYWYAAKPTHPGMKSWWPAPGAKNAQCGKGEVLGDWRDTLEKRPEEFKPFTSIEDNQEKDMKQDNGWFERGELPPVGTSCEFHGGMRGGCMWPDELKDGDQVSILCHYDPSGGGLVAVFSFGVDGGRFVSQAIASCFHPIRTERDALLSVIVEEMNRYDTDGKLADAILAAGFSLGAK